jgi:hypothetical protein
VLRNDSQEKQELRQRQEGNLYRILYAERDFFDFKMRSKQFGRWYLPKGHIP